MAEQTAAQRIVNLLQDTKRANIGALIDYLMESGFFEAPASTRYHGCYPGGLADHSLGVYDRLLVCWSEFKLEENTFPGMRSLEITEQSIKIAALLHDVCKIGAYVPTATGKGYRWNRAQPKGHAVLSISRVLEHITLTELELLMIRYHMGIYGTYEFFVGEKYPKGEYPLRGDPTKSSTEKYGQSLMNAWHHNPICKLMYFCDQFATFSERAMKVE